MHLIRFAALLGNWNPLSHPLHVGLLSQLAIAFRT